MKRVMQQVIQTGFLWLIFGFVALNCFSLNARSVKTLDQVKCEYTRESDGIKGSVYSVVTKDVSPITAYGEIIRIDERLTDSIVYDNEGRYHRRYDFGSSPVKKYHYTHINDTVIIKEYGENGKPKIKKKVTLYDSEHRIKNVTIYSDNDRILSRQTYEYEAGGYKGHFYYETNKEIPFAREGKEFVYNDGGRINVITFDKANKAIKEVEILPLIGEFTTYYKYDQHGSLIAEGSKNLLGNNIIGKANLGGDTKVWEYKYDEHGNWIEKYSYDKKGNKSKGYTKRVITYKSPEEIIALQTGEQDRVRAFFDKIQEKGQKFADSIVNNKKMLFEECLIAYAESFKDKSGTLRSFATDGTYYTFIFSDGKIMDQLTFPRRHRNNGVNLLSSDSRVVLSMERSSKGPLWYVIRYGEMVKFDFNPNLHTDWAELYREKYDDREDVPSEEIEKIWREEIEKQWKNSKESTIVATSYSIPEDSVCVNKIIQPYDNGWVSPELINKELENELLEKYRTVKEQEERENLRKNLCSIAIKACEFDKKSKPKAAKLKKISTSVGCLTVKTQAGTELVCTGFETKSSYSQRDYNTTAYNSTDVVFLNQDCNLALVIKTASPEKTYGEGTKIVLDPWKYEPKTYLFVVQLEKDIPVSVSYAPLEDCKNWQLVINENELKYKF